MQLRDHGSIICKGFVEKEKGIGIKKKISDAMVGGTVTVTPIKELADKLHKPVIRKF